MRSRSLALVLAALSPLVVRAVEASGFVRTDEGALELTGPRSFFGVYQTPRVAPAAPATAAPALAPGAPREDPCRSERSRYVRALLRMAGIDLEDPLAFLDGLSGAQTQNTALFSAYGLLGGVDPIRPLAWDLELRSLARELTRCGRGAAH